MFQRVDRFQVEPPSEVRPYLLTPEESRTHFKPREEKQTWYDFRLMPNEKMTPEKFKEAGKVIFISKGADDFIVGSFFNEHGQLDFIRTDFSVPDPLKITTEMKERVLECAIKGRHIQPTSEVMYRGVPCVTDTEWSQEKEAMASKLPAHFVNRFTVPHGSIGKIMINGRAEFVRPGRHIIMEENIKECVHESLANKRIMHGNRCILSVFDEEYVYARDPAAPKEDYKLLTAGIHLLEKKLILANVNEPYGLDVKVRFDNGVEETLFVKIAQGKIGVALDQDPRMQRAPLEERLHILDQGVNAMNAVFLNEVLDARVSSKMGILECKLSAFNQNGKEVNINVKLHYKLDKDNVFYTYQRFYNKNVKDSITKAIEATVIRELTSVISSNPNVSEANLLPDTSIRALNNQFLRLPMEVESIQGSTIRYRKMNLQGQIAPDTRRKIEEEALRQYRILSASPGITNGNIVAALNDKLREMLGEPMVTIDKVSYSMQPKNLVDEHEQDLTTIARIKEEQRALIAAFQSDMASQQQRRCPMTEEMGRLQEENGALDRTLAELNSKLDEEWLSEQEKLDGVLAESLHEFGKNNLDLSQTCATLAFDLKIQENRSANREVRMQQAPEEKQSQRRPNRHGLMSLNPSSSRARPSRARDDHCSIS